MYHRISLIVASLVLSSSVALAAEPKPSVCREFKAFAAVDGSKVYLCLDGKRPAVFSRGIVVPFVDRDGKPASYLLGWR